MASPLDAPDTLLLCYCTGLTLGELRAGCRLDRWPPPGREESGKLCTGCMGDLRLCLRVHGATAAGGDEPPAPAR
jgi:hypothetical protein